MNFFPFLKLKGCECAQWRFTDCCFPVKRIEVFAYNSWISYRLQRMTDLCIKVERLKLKLFMSSLRKSLVLIFCAHIRCKNTCLLDSTHFKFRNDIVILDSEFQSICERIGFFYEELY